LNNSTVKSQILSVEFAF